MPRRDVAAVFAVFAVNGAALGSWATRVPAITTQVGARPGGLGLALLGASVGMIVAAAFTGRACERFGSRAMVLVSGLAACVVLPIIGWVSSVPALGVVLFGMGATVGALDVAMNVAAVKVLRRAERPLMPVFHAGFSIGALLGSAASGLAAASGWNPLRHLAVAAIVAAVVLACFGTVLPAEAPVVHPTDGGAPPRRGLWRRPVLWLLAAVALCSAIAEGASSDWSALLMVTAKGVGPGAAALAYSGFSLAMAAARLAGAWVERRAGRWRMLLVGAALAGAGLACAAVVPSPAAGYLGFLLAGGGLAYSFPVALGLAGEVGRRGEVGGEREIGFVTTLAYAGFLAGPPLIGEVAQAWSLMAAFVLVAVIATAIAPAALLVRQAMRRETRRNLPLVRTEDSA
ncbi:MAG: MFS transporter [Sciscionella sp.]